MYFCIPLARTPSIMHQHNVMNNIKTALSFHLLAVITALTLCPVFITLIVFMVHFTVLYIGLSYQENSLLYQHVCTFQSHKGGVISLYTNFNTVTGENIRTVSDLRRVSVP